MTHIPIQQLQIRVTEKHGIRRFLYPLQTDLQETWLEPLVLVDSEGTILPSEFVTDRDDDSTMCYFAISLAPFEAKILYIEYAHGRTSIIPDPLRAQDLDGKLRISQERVAYTLDSKGTLCSVLYDGVEHLAGDVFVELIEREERKYTQRRNQWIDEGLNATVYKHYDNTWTLLTSCKSWATICRQRFGMNPGGIGRFTVPLQTISNIQTCDFGLGNGAYARLEKGVIDQVSVKVDFRNNEAPVYEIASHFTGKESPRIDYAGRCESWIDATSRLWMHWNEPSKAVAIAIPDVPLDTETVSLTISSNGMTVIEFKKLDDPTLEQHLSATQYCVCYHFLNAIPPIAAATNPASIICKPEVVVETINSVLTGQ